MEDFQKKFAFIANQFPVFADVTSGMHQYAIWTSLCAEGLGVNLQHYNPLMDAKVASEWGLPETWDLKAQMVFGTALAGPGEKTHQPIEERFKVFGA